MPGVVDLVVYEGDTWQAVVTILDQAGVPVVLPTSGWAAQVRWSPKGTLQGQLTVDASEGASGRLSLSVPAEGSRGWTNGVWDLQQTDDSVVPVVTTWLAGRVIVRADVTHD